MFIVTQKKNAVINVDSLISIEINENIITATLSKDDYVIGKYETTQRAEEVFQDLLKNIVEPTIMMTGCISDSCIKQITGMLKTDKVIIVEDKEAKIEFVNSGFYYMPEK